MADELIVNFPTHRDRSMMMMRSVQVQFADTPETYIVDRHADNQDVDQHDLWYNESDYFRMRLAVKKSVLEVRAMRSAGVPISYTLATTMAHPMTMTALLASNISSRQLTQSGSRSVGVDVSERSSKNKQGKE